MGTCASADINEIFYCTDEGQGIDHKCITFFQGLCSRIERCRYHLSEYQVNKLKLTWKDIPEMNPWETNIDYIIRGM